MLTSRAFTIGTAATRVAVAGSSPMMATFHNDSGQAVFLGDSAVTATTGLHFGNKEDHSLMLFGGNEIYACTASGAANLIFIGQQL